MKKFLLAVVALTTIVVSAHAMSYEQASPGFVSHR